MKPVTAIVADDEAPLRKYLIKLLAEIWPELVIEAEAKNGPQALELVKEFEPDIIFLDINMPGMNGIQVAEKICQQCSIIFITAYDEYAINAFDNEAVDYILKPVQKERLKKSIERCKKIVLKPSQEPENLISALKQIESSLLKHNETRYLQWIRAQHGETIRLIATDDVELFRSDHKYTLVVTSEKESLIRTTIKELELVLDPKKFWKINRGAIINVSSVLKISKSLTGKYVIKLNNYDEPLMVSKSYSHLFRTH